MRLISYDRLRTPLGRARGWGSAHHGASHWLNARVWSIALIPLVGWFVWSVLHLMQADHGQVALFLQKPWNAIAMGLFVAISAYHGAEGLQTVLEDYVGQAWRIPATILIKFAALLLTIVSLYAILLMAFSTGIR